MLAAALILTSPVVAAPHAAHASSPAQHSFLISSATGPVHYPACAGPITWTLATQGIAASGSTERREMALWQAIFTEISAATAYRFVHTDAAQRPAQLTIHYTTDPASVGVNAAALAPGTAGLGGITALAWNGTHWVATASTVILNPTELTQWNHVRGLREWVARHELGHALGLGHTDDPTQIMAPKYNPLFPQRTYQANDIAGLQALAQASCPQTNS